MYTKQIRAKTGTLNEDWFDLNENRLRKLNTVKKKKKRRRANDRKTEDERAANLIEKGMTDIYGVYTNRHKSTLRM